MDEPVGRLLAVLGVLVVAVAIALLGRRVARRHPPVDLRSAGIDDRVVVFTSTDCSNCAAALAALKRRGVAFREVTWELEGGKLEAAGVRGVPLIVFRDPAGATVAQIGGKPRPWELRRAIRRLAG